MALRVSATDLAAVAVPVPVAVSDLRSRWSGAREAAPAAAAERISATLLVAVATVVLVAERTRPTALTTVAAAVLVADRMSPTCRERVAVPVALAVRSTGVTAADLADKVAADGGRR